VLPKVFAHIVRSDLNWGEVAEAILGHAHADMAERIEDALVRKDSIGVDQVRDMRVPCSHLDWPGARALTEVHVDVLLACETQQFFQALFAAETRLLVAAKRRA
jgi:hypothetical protein